MSNRFNTDCQIQGDTFIDQIIQNPVKFNSNGPSHNLNLSESNFHSGASLLSKLVSPEACTSFESPRISKKTYSVWQPTDCESCWKASKVLGTMKITHENPSTEELNFRQDKSRVSSLYLSTCEKFDEYILNCGDSTKIIQLQDIPNPDSSTKPDINDTIILSSDTFRENNFQVSKSLSWEKSILQICKAIFENDSCRKIREYHHILVTFGSDGCLYITRNQKSKNNYALSNYVCYIIFDQCGNEFEYTAGDASVFGYLIVFQAAITKSLLSSPNLDIPNTKKCNLKDTILKGVLTGLNAMRRLHDFGFEKENNSLLFPTDRIVDVIEAGLSTYRVRDSICCEKVQPKGASQHKIDMYSQSKPISLSDILKKDESFSILNSESNLDELARNIARYGFFHINDENHGFPNIPFCQFGKLITVEKSEIEKFRAVMLQLRNYIDSNLMKPLSIAVFGQPGTGKSFGIKQIVSHLVSEGKKSVSILEFNLSQMDTITDLIGALQLVRDEGLKGNVPLVFWDEFDTPKDGQILGWIKYFLSPMEDGSFQGGQTIHPIGRAIFIFAGSCSHSLSEFSEKIGSHNAADSKGRDFVSRLKGYVDIIGPNPKKESKDESFAVRRAILIHSMLKRRFPEYMQLDGSLNIDEHILSALLNVESYNHGARSIESIINMSTSTNRKRYNFSCLPTDDQLNLHLDTEKFKSLIMNSIKNS